ncbi:hypothetical protein GGR40_003793 [Novosphingobium gossypii]
MIVVTWPSLPGGRGATGSKQQARHCTYFRLKALLRTIGERAISGLWSLVGKLVDIF